MTWKELADKILTFDAATQSGPAIVFPPATCPATTSVPITGWDHGPDGTRPMLVTGKKPQD